MANPVTDTTRPIANLLDQAAAACNEAGVPGKVYTGTTYAGLATMLPGLLVESQGRPCAVVVYGGSTYANKPRRTSAIKILIIQGHTRVAPGTAQAIESAQAVIAALDDVIYQDVVGDYPITDHWRVAEDEVVDLEGLESAACVVVTFNVEDY